MLSQTGDTRYEVFWFLHAVMIDGVLDLVESQTERRYVGTLQEAYTIAEAAIESADRRCVSIQLQLYEIGVGGAGSLERNRRSDPD